MKYIPSMNILFITDGLYVGGRERQVLALIKGIRYKRAGKIYLAIIQHGGEFQAEAESYADKTFSVKREYRYDVGYPFRLLEQTKGLSFDVVFAVGWMASCVALVFSRIRKIPYIDGGIRYAPPQLTWQDKIQRFACHRADAVVANAAACLKAYHLEGHPKARVIYNGIDALQFDALATKPQTNTPLLCMVANFSKYKDHVTPIKALKLLEDKFQDLKLIFVGKDYGTLSHTKKIIEELGLQDRVCLFHEEKEPHQIISTASIGILTSNALVHGEGCSNTILEYMALGMPVIANDLGGNAELVKDGVNGFLIPYAAEMNLAEKISFLLLNPQAMHQMGEKGKEIVNQKFNLERMVNEYIKIYFEVLDKRQKNE